jgi:AraC-like DNA-binding protein
VKEYQLRMRLTRARELMEDEGLSITAIAEKVGIENLPYFSRLFKREFHVSPSRVPRITRA